MTPFSLRALTPAETSLAAEMFGQGLDAARVRLLAIPVWPRAFVAGPGLIVWPAAQAWPDFGDAPLAAQAVFVHELTHVWQAQNGVALLLAKIKAGDGARAYAYDLMSDEEFTALNIEQQAMVVQHAFLAARGQATQHPAEIYAGAASGWRRA